MNTRRKSTLFLVEQLIVIAVFALCAVACISILTTSYFMAVRSKETADALIAAQNCAEAFKAAGGDTEGTAYILGGDPETAGYLLKGATCTVTGDFVENFTLTAYYDSAWQHIGGEQGDGFVLTLSGSVEPGGDGRGLAVGEISVGKVTGENLVRLPVAAAKR